MPLAEDQLDIMASLKDHTAEAHQQVERLMPFFADQLRLGTYAATLSAFLGFFEPMEHRLAAIPGWRLSGSISRNAGESRPCIWLLALAAGSVGSGQAESFFGLRI